MMDALSQPLQARLDRELDPGESVLWTSQPDPKLLKKGARGSCWAIALVCAVVVLSIAVLWWLIPPMPNDPEDKYIPPILMAIFAAFGAIGIIAVLINTRIESRQLYAITNHRAIVIGFRTKRHSTERDYCPDELARLSRTERPDGTGSIQFVSARSVSTATSFHGFKCIHNVIEIERMLRKHFGKQPGNIADARV